MTPTGIGAPEQLDEFRLIRPVGQGMTGQVWLGQDTLLERPVAVKLIAGEPTPQARDRFLVEARAIARLHHPNVVAIYRIGEREGRPYLVSEFVPGQSLDKVARPLGREQATPVALGLARGLAAAHRAGVLHRDVKPANAILATNGEVKLLDFGLAKLATGEGDEAFDDEAQALEVPHTTPWAGTLPEDGAPPLPSLPPPTRMRRFTPSPLLTRTGASVGTPLYMAPEIWRGDPATTRSDVYSLGALLFHLLTDRPPHEGESLESLRRSVLEGTAAPLADVEPNVDRGVAAAVDRCLMRDPAKRFASADELRDALEQLQPGPRTAQVPAGNPYRGLKPFEPAHRALFFGRCREANDLIERMRFEAFVLVAGDSGVGKSSLCRAAVLTAVEEGALGERRQWSVATMVPGRRPLATLCGLLARPLASDEAALARRDPSEYPELARALRLRQDHGEGSAVGLLLFVDQLEELVTLSDPTEAAAVGELLACLTAQVPGLRLLATVRSDFLARVSALPGLGEGCLRALYLLRPLLPDGIREAIVGPARTQGVRFESDALVDQLVASTSEAAGGLPLLQFALAELWEARDGERRTIPASALSAVGGVAGALARHADSVVAALTLPQRRAARRLLVGLVTPDGTRARRAEAELTDGDEDGRTALAALVRGRLVVACETDDGTAYEVAHEALLGGWAALRRWLEEDAEGNAARERVAIAAAEWERLGRAGEALFAARQLAELPPFSDEALAPRARDFLLASRRQLVRRRWARRGLGAGVPLAILLLWGGLRFNAHLELERRVTGHVRAAQAILREVDSERRELERLRSAAFAQFDSFERDAGEQTWAEALRRAANLDRADGRATQALEGALVLDGGRDDARALMGDLLYQRALNAERDHHPTQYDELLERLVRVPVERERADRNIVNSQIGAS